MTFEETFPNQRLRHARHLKRWSQSDLATALDTDFETVSRWERGITVPNPFYREKLCDLFKKTSEELGLQMTLNTPAFPLVFLASAYVDAEQSIVALLKAKLQVRGVTIWSSRTVRRHGEENKKKALQEAIRAAQAILLIVSPEARTSRQVQETLRIANLYQQQIFTIWIDGKQWQECIPNISIEIEAQFDARQPYSSTLLDEIIDRLEQTWLAAEPAVSFNEIAEPVSPSSESLAEDTYTALPSDAHRKLARTLFLRVVDPGTDEQVFRRRHAALTELSLSDAQKTRIFQEVVDAFVKTGLLTTNEINRTITLAVSHEAVLHQWQRLATWIKEARMDMRVLHTISADASAWEQYSKPRDRLYRGTQLSEAHLWASRNILSSNEAAFLKASATYRVRAKVNLTALLLSLVLVTGLITHLLFTSGMMLSDTFLTTVTTLQDDGPGSLRAAIDAATPGSTITFSPNLKGTIKLTDDDLNIFKPLTIHGPGGGRLAISAGKSLHRIHIFKGAAVSIIGLDFKDSTNTDLGFIYNSGTLTLTNDSISNNQTYTSFSGVDGGGIYNDGLLTLINSTVANNRAGSANDSGTSIGGGIFNVGTLNLSDSTVSGNQANIGGGIYSLGKLVLTNSTVSNNAATGKEYSYGGGVAIEEGQADLTFCTIAGNITARGGGISVEVGDGAHPQLAIKDSLVENNYASIEPGISGELVSNSYNLIQGLSYASSGNPLRRTFLDTPANSAAFLGISATLQDNGGPTQTLALLPGSPAEDQIPRDACHPNGITTDQRGLKRPHGTEPFCDIGAYES